MILGLETSTATGGAALLENGRLLGAVSFTSPALQAQRLLPSVEWLLDRAGRDVSAISAIAVSIGPGSFTGLRIGLSAAKALAYANKAPLFGIGTLEALALRAATGAAGLAPMPPVCALLDARQGEVYAALFEIVSAPPVPGPDGTVAPPSLRRLREDYAGPLDAFLAESIACPTLFAGDGVFKYRAVLAEHLGPNFLIASAIRNVPSAEEVAWLGTARLARGERDDADLLAPDYLRRSYTQTRKA